MARLIITRDKTHVKGKLLVDDKPFVTGTGIPSWEHVVFTAPYNLALTDRKRLSSWNDWRKVLLHLLEVRTQEQDQDGI
jgi:5'-nucleotidase